MPGERPFAKRALPPAEALSSTYLTFRDTEGRYWVRAANGDFRELKHRERGQEDHVIPETIYELSAVPPPDTMRHLAFLRGGSLRAADYGQWWHLRRRDRRH
jgi:hypothetical protein